MAAAVVVVVAGMVVVAAVALPRSPWAASRDDAARTAAWSAAHGQLAGTPLPAGVAPAPESCPGFLALLCGWTDASPQEALRALAEQVAASTGGTSADAPSCGPGAVAEEVRPLGAEGVGTRVCGVPVSLAGTDLWLLATDHSMDGALPLGRTLAWAQWDQASMPEDAIGRLHSAMGDLRPGTPPEAEVTAEDLTPLLPARFAALTASECEPSYALPDVCLTWTGPVQGTAADSAAIVEELAAAGFVVRSTHGDRVWGERSVGPGSAAFLRLSFEPDQQGGLEGRLLLAQ